MQSVWKICLLLQSSSTTCLLSVVENSSQQMTHSLVTMSPSFLFGSYTLSCEEMKLFTPGIFYECSKAFSKIKLHQPEAAIAVRKQHKIRIRMPKKSHKKMHLVNVMAKIVLQALSLIFNSGIISEFFLCKWISSSFQSRISLLKSIENPQLPLIKIAKIRQ